MWMLQAVCHPVNHRRDGYEDSSMEQAATGAGCAPDSWGCHRSTPRGAAQRAASGGHRAASDGGGCAPGRIRPATYLITCDDEAVVEPVYFDLLCGNGLFGLDQLTWTNWGQPVAHATGRYLLKDCTPSCANGTVLSYPVQVEASGLTQQDATTVYGAMTLRFTGAKPEWDDGDTMTYTYSIDEYSGHGNEPYSAD